MDNDQPCPADVTPQLWELILSTNKDTAAMRSQLDSLEEKFSVLDSKGNQHDCDITELRGAVNVLTARLARSDIEQRSLRHEVQDLQAHSMKEYLISHFDSATPVCREFRGEDCSSVIKMY